MSRFHGHSTACAEAIVTTPKECECPCVGMFHGGPHTWRARALAGPPDGAKPYSRKQVKEALTDLRRSKEDADYGRRATDYITIHAVDVLIQTDSADQDLLREAIESVVGPFAAEIAQAGLDKDQERRVRSYVNERHLLCALVVAILKAHREAEEALKRAAKAIADAVVDPNGKVRGVSDREELFRAELGGEVLKNVLETTFAAANSSGGALDAALHAVVRAAVEHALLAMLHLLMNPANVHALQLLGILFCPNIEGHPAVVEFCEKPLAGVIVAEAVASWVQAGFLNSATFLKLKTRHPKW